MARNRTEAKTQVNTKIVPTVTNVTHRDLLNNDLIESLLFRKDVIVTEPGTGGAIAIDFSTKDLAKLSITANGSITFSNLENGDIKYMSITKSAGATLTFPGATDASLAKSYINDTALTVVYRIENKDSIISINSINIDTVLISTTWIVATTGGSWTVVQPVKYRKNTNGDVQIVGLISGSVNGTVLFTLPTGYRPAYQKVLPFANGSTLSVNAFLLIATNGEVTVFRDGGSSLSNATINNVMLID